MQSSHNVQHHATDLSMCLASRARTHNLGCPLCCRSQVRNLCKHLQMLHQLLLLCSAGDTVCTLTSRLHCSCLWDTTCTVAGCLKDSVQEGKQQHLARHYCCQAKVCHYQHLLRSGRSCQKLRPTGQQLRHHFLLLKAVDVQSML